MTPEQERELVKKMMLDMALLESEEVRKIVAEDCLSVVRTSIKEHPERFVRVCPMCLGRGHYDVINGSEAGIIKICSR
jgi:hypothetical protein